MSLVPNRRSLAVAARTGFNSTILALIDEFLLHEGIAKSDVHRYRYPARHFLIWLQCSGLAIESVDGTVIDDFLRHDCRCAAWSAPVRLRRWRKCRTSPYLMRFIHFLERTGRIETPGDLDENFRVLEAFLERLRGDSYATQTVKLYRYGCAGLLVWLHLSRIRLSDLTAEVYARFRNRQFVCSIPGVFCGHRAPSPGTAYATEVRGFLKHLVAIGRIEPLQPSPQLPGLLERFSVWLERNRGIGPGTVRQHVRLIARILPGLGDEPRTYDAARVRRVLFEQIKCWSPTYAQKLTTSMRMYLRFLVSEGYIAPALVEAVPTVPRWRLSGLPRYIPADDVERAIASCGDDALGVRDRAILLLLARLALRAGDIVALRLADIDWDRAQIRVSGKSRQETALPLPQDAGDALYAYIATVRPRTSEEQVFLCVNAPYGPFVDGSNVSSVAKRALNRAGVKTPGSRGAYVFRHSQATALLRSGASLDVIQSLLRHASPNTTMIYAKTDAVMLREVAQPWIGGGER